MMGTIAPPAARALARLHEAGFEAWLVGGCVRDMLLGCAPKDYDLATSARPEETKAVFQGETVLETGIRHGTVTVLLEGMPLEITTYRVDGAYSDARHPDGVTFADNLRADAARRDFTSQCHGLCPGAGAAGLFWGAGRSAGGMPAGGGGPRNPVSGGCPADSPGTSLRCGAGFFPGRGDRPGGPAVRPPADQGVRRAVCCGVGKAPLRPGGRPDFTGLPRRAGGGDPGAAAHGGLCPPECPPLL